MNDPRVGEDPGDGKSSSADPTHASALGSRSPRPIWLAVFCGSLIVAFALAGLGIW